MVVKFSRHAKRRIKLYKIPQETIIDITKHLKIYGKQKIIKQVKSYKYPIKIICMVEKDMISVITAYPLKRGLP